MKIPKSVCTKCNENIAIHRLTAHVRVCVGKPLKRYAKYEIVDGKAVCPICGEHIHKYGIGSHVQQFHNGKKFNTSITSWNKGLTKETDERVRITGEKNKGKIPWSAGKPLPEKTKKKLSESMKKAHAEGRAHNIGECRWNNSPSYPEKFFMQVIENEFSDKLYIREHPFFRYSLDFAWVHLKKVIEIDGEQHYRDVVQMSRDRRKDKLLEEEGWQLLRIKWTDMYAEPKKLIAIANNFIHQNT